MTRPREAAPSFVSAGSPREGSSSSRSPPAHTPGVSKELETRRPPPLRPPPADPRPFLPLGAAPPAPAAPPPPRGPLCLGRLSASSPPRPRGETGLPPETKTAANTGAAAAEGASREGARTSDTHPHPTPREVPGVRPGPQGRQAPGSPLRRAALSQLPTGPEPPAPLPSRPPRPPVPGTQRPRSARGRRGRRESPAPSPAANSPASAGAASREEAREAQRQSGSADARGDRMQVRVPASGRPEAPPTRRPPPPQPRFSSRRRVRASGRGRGSLTRWQAPRTTWLPGRRVARTAH